MTYILYGTGLEEIEAITVADILRRAQIPMQTVGIGGREITGAHGLVLKTDITVEEMDTDAMECIVLPGGMGGVEAIEGSPAAMTALDRAYASDCVIAAICAAPCILGRKGWLDGKKAVCYPTMEQGLGNAIPQPDAAAVVDGRFVTGRAPGAAMEFALTLTEVLAGREKADLVSRFLVYDR